GRHPRLFQHLVPPRQLRADGGRRFCPAGGEGADRGLFRRDRSRPIVSPVRPDPRRNAKRAARALPIARAAGANLSPLPPAAHGRCRLDRRRSSEQRADLGQSEPPGKIAGLRKADRTDVAAYVLPTEATGMLLLQATAKEEVAIEEVEQTIDDELRRLVAGGISEDELTRAKNRAEVDFAHQIENYDSRADLIGM